MVGFVIPFKSKEKSKNWELDCALLDRTLKSVLNQTDKNFKCYVTYTDLPKSPRQHEKIVWVQFPFPFATADKIEDAEKYNSFGKEKKHWEHLPFFYDQGRKSLYGTAQAKKEGCQYIMMLDADDLLSNKITCYINQQDPSTNVGFYVNQGYLYAENGSLLIKVPDQMNFMCGSVNIIRGDVIPETDFSINTYENYSFFAAHSYVRTRIQYSHSETIKPLPFYGLVYVFHSTNEMASKTDLKKLSLRNLAKKIIRGKLITPAVRKEFGIYKLTQ
ncbi:MAG TPA: hypothetical protein VMR70_02030 [Flavisolibacter sp.]|nr:hypothetical protein [Flavisolibacter sp.]